MEYELSHADITPGDGFSVLPIPENEGIHTGGLYLSPDGLEVFKPLDVKPYPNATVRVESNELRMLELMAGKPGFPKNWRVEEVRGRKFLVRSLCQVIGQHLPYNVVSLEQILEIEQWLRQLNASFWEINDHLAIAWDDKIQELFILDLSAAQPMGNPDLMHTAYLADDTQRFSKFAYLCGYQGLVDLRQEAKHLTSSIAWLKMQMDGSSPLTEEHVHVYASRNRPLNSRWSRSRIPDGVYFNGNAQVNVLGWVVTPKPLEAQVCKDLELTWAYSPIPYQI